MAKPITLSSLDGINGTIFAYGQTSSGKTFTMKGTRDFPGVIPLSIQDIFRQVESTPNREFLLRVSYIEIYNENIRDLLAGDNKTLKIREDLERGVFVDELKEEIVVSAAQVLQLMEMGEGRKGKKKKRTFLFFVSMLFFFFVLLLSFKSSSTRWPHKHERALQQVAHYLPNRH
jgi:hypothetical protein